LLGLGWSLGVEIGKAEVIAIVVSGRIDALPLLKELYGFRKPSSLNVEFAKVVVGLVITGLEGKRFAELLFRWGELAKANKVGGKVRVSGRRVRFQADGLFEVLAGLRVLLLCGIDQAQKFMNLKTIRNRLEQAIELRRGFGVAGGFILSDRGLEFFF
jgi:hypothetical protein